VVHTLNKREVPNLVFYAFCTIASSDGRGGHASIGSSSQGRSAGRNTNCLGFVDSGGTPRGGATAEPGRDLPDYYYY
jgi:hypothetical protein